METWGEPWKDEPSSWLHEKDALRVTLHLRDDEEIGGKKRHSLHYNHPWGFACLLLSLNREIKQSENKMKIK
jgi:hypothetical protein